MLNSAGRRVLDDFGIRTTSIARLVGAVNAYEPQARRARTAGIDLLTRAQQFASTR